MDSATARLAALRVEDIMVQPVVTVRVNSTMSAAAAVFVEHQISGAPVVDDLGQCVGFLSASHFVKSRAEEMDGSKLVSHYLRANHPSGLYSINELRCDLVQNHMSSACQSVGRGVPLLQAAKTMCQERVHRLLVIDTNGAPVGILTSIDLVATITFLAED